jgi:ribosomal protein L13E
VLYLERLAARTSWEELPISLPAVRRAMPDELDKNLLAAPCIQPDEEDEAKRTMTTWHKRDWQQFYELARRPWQRHRPPRPVYPTGLNRVLPAQGFSLSELDDAGVDLDLAESLGLPVDAGRIGAYGPNVTVLRDFVRSSRQPR